ETGKKVPAGYKVQPLSAFLGTPAPPSPPKIDFLKPPSAEQERKSLDFFNGLHFLLQFCPTHPSEKELRARFAKLGIGAGGTFNASKLAPEIRKALEDGMSDAWTAFLEQKKLMDAGKVSSADVFGTREYLENNYLYRMSAAVLGIYGNSKEEAIYPLYFIDSNGQKLDASQNRYTLRFAKDQLPPVNAFWSLTMYRLPESLLVSNPLNRYLINSPMLPQLKRDPHGGPTPHVPDESQGKNQEANWPPAPKGPFLAVLRLYWPKPEAFNRTWKAPPLERIG